MSNRPNRIKNYRTDEKIINTIKNAIKRIKENSDEKIDQNWLQNMSFYTFDTLIMSIFDLDHVTKYTVNYEELKLAANDMIKNELIELEKQEELKNDIWLKFLENIKSLNFKIIQNNTRKCGKLSDIYIEHKEHFLIGYLSGGYKEGIIEAMIFFNATEKTSSKESKYQNLYHKGTNILIGNTSIKENPKKALEKIINEFNIEERWIDSNMKNYVPEDFFSSYNQHKIDHQLVLKMSYYNLPKEIITVPTFNIRSSFQEKFNSAFNKLTQKEINNLHTRSIILNIKKDCKRFIKERYIAHFENNGITKQERIYLITALLFRLELVKIVENPFNNIRKTISQLDIDDCLELMEIVKKHNKMRYSKYKLNSNDFDFFEGKNKNNANRYLRLK